MNLLEGWDWRPFAGRILASIIAFAITTLSGWLAATNLLAPEQLEALRPTLIEILYWVAGSLLSAAGLWDWAQFQKWRKSQGYDTPEGRAPLVLIVALSMAMSTSARAQGDRYAIVYDFRAKETVVTAGYRTLSFPDFLGVKGLEPEVWTVAGYRPSAATGSVGGAVVVPLRAARNLTLYLGGLYYVTFPEQPRYGLVLGARVGF